MEQRWSIFNRQRFILFRSASSIRWLHLWQQKLNWFQLRVHLRSTCRHMGKRILSCWLFQCFTTSSCIIYNCLYALIRIKGPTRQPYIQTKFPWGLIAIQSRVVDLHWHRSWSLKLYWVCNSIYDDLRHVNSITCEGKTKRNQALDRDIWWIKGSILAESLHCRCI